MIQVIDGGPGRFWPQLFAAFFFVFIWGGGGVQKKYPEGWCLRFVFFEGMNNHGSSFVVIGCS